MLTLLWHHSVFNENEFPGWESDYAKILDYCKKQNAWIGSGRQIHEWWTQREKTTIDWEYENAIFKNCPTIPLEQQHFITIYIPDSLKLKEVNNATIISVDQNHDEIKTNVLDKEEFVEVTFHILKENLHRLDGKLIIENAELTTIFNSLSQSSITSFNNQKFLG